ncbi:hypothetical protein NIES4071_64070 [Calothrix sp. NIES-4071]|nr:hypothetical protein NIES4071_64070 [Calothrix sp. NIES-4071]BAZ60711.1 hypothetical protein NIES4105_64030 [Calothrix sp. NIES-4105]
MTQLQLLVLSNGHGEDIVATKILHSLLELENAPQIFVLPLAGEGHAYKKLDIPFIGSVQAMPSGGFLYMDSKQLVRDVKGGLIQLTLNQIKATKQWVKEQNALGKKSAVLAVGDIVPLLFGFISGANYAFVGTAKSEYYVRSEVGLLKRTNKGAYWENFSGSIYHPWERWLMTRRRCKAVFPRDSLTTEILQKMNVRAFDLGNPMMDGLEPSFPTYRSYSIDAEHKEIIRPLIVTLLPGSRAPEAYANWEKIMIGVSSLLETMYAPTTHTSKSLVLLGAIAGSLDCNILSTTLISQGWRRISLEELPLKFSDTNALTFKQKNAHLVLTQNAYNDCLHMGDMAIAMAGTATEQFIGLGKPAFIIPGEGPQFTPGFAEAQSRLLGDSIILVEQAANIGQQVQNFFAYPDKLHVIAKNGLRRMGSAGAAQRIAQCIIDKLS